MGRLPSGEHTWVRNCERRGPVSYTHLRAHETVLDLVCRLLLEKKQNHTEKHSSPNDWHMRETLDTEETDNSGKQQTMYEEEAKYYRKYDKTSHQHD